VGAAELLAPRNPAETRLNLYLVYSGQSSPENGWRVEGSVYRASDHLCLVRTTLGRSRVYHSVKRQMSGSAPLLVAPLSGDPKFKGMASGTLDWLRRAETVSIEADHGSARH
jgi:hypothetical protein